MGVSVWGLFGGILLKTRILDEKPQKSLNLSLLFRKIYDQKKIDKRGIKKKNGVLKKSKKKKI